MASCCCGGPSFSAIRFVRTLCAALGAVLLTAGMVLAQSRPAALITDLSGAVEISQGTQTVKAGLMAGLPAGARVVVRKGGSVSLAFTRGGVRARISGPCTATLTETDLKVAKGQEKQVERVKPRHGTALALAGGVNFQQMGGTRVRNLGSAIVVEADPFVLDTTPRIEWTTSEPLSSVDVRIMTRGDNYSELIRTTLPGSAVSYLVPPGKLEYGKSYDILVSGIAGQRTLQARTRTIEVLDKATAAQVHKAANEAEQLFKAKPSDITPLVLLLSMYTELGLNSQAIVLGERIHALRPQEFTVVTTLMRFYEMRGDLKRVRELQDQMKPNSH